MSKLNDNERPLVSIPIGRSPDQRSILTLKEPMVISDVTINGIELKWLQSSEPGDGLIVPIDGELVFRREGVHRLIIFTRKTDVPTKSEGKK